MRLDVEHPLDIDDARRASRRLAELRREAEDVLQSAVEKVAEAERDYRKRASQAHANVAGKSFTTAKARDAAAAADASDARYERDLAEGMVKVAVERLRGLEREGAALRSLTEWSARMYEREIPTGQTYGGRQAA